MALLEDARQIMRVQRRSLSTEKTYLAGPSSSSVSTAALRAGEPLEDAALDVHHVGDGFELLAGHLKGRRTLVEGEGRVRRVLISSGHDGSCEGSWRDCEPPGAVDTYMLRRGHPVRRGETCLEMDASGMVPPA